jgi:peptide/nickel transport system substrate-binding protein
VRTRRLTWAATGVVAALALAACGGGGGGGGGGGASSDAVLDIGTNSSIDSINPFVAFSQLSYATFINTYPYLVQYDPELGFEGYLADSWETTNAGKTWAFTLHDGAVWSDGEPLDSEDVKWTLDTMIAGRSGGAVNTSGLITNLKSVTAPDPTTVELTYSKPTAPVLGNMQQLPILPPQVWEKYATGDDLKGLKTADLQVPDDMVSGGPFEVVKYEKKTFIGLQANDSFWLDDAKPKIAGYGLTQYKDNDAMVAALQSGEIDLIESLPASFVDPVKQDGFNVDANESVFWYDFIFNSNPDKPEHRELLDPKVREAFEYGFNRQEMIDKVWLGTAQPGASIVPPVTSSPETPWSDPSVQPLPYDPDKANQILDDLGYKKGPDGIRTVPGTGDKMSYEIIFPELDDTTRIFELLERWMTDIGVELKLKQLDSSAAFDAIGAPDYKYLDFDLAFWNWVPLIDPDFILSVLTCDQYGGWSDTGYCNPEYDKMYVKQAGQVDPQERLATVYAMQQMAYNDRPYIVVAYIDWVSASSPDWSGFDDGPQGPYNALSIRAMTEVEKTS